MKLISFGIASKYFDNELRITIDSILACHNSLALIEIVVVLSCQASVQRLLEYINKLPSSANRLHVKIDICSEGVYPAFNRCILLASSKYILFLGAGETLYCDNIQWFFDCAERCDIDFFNFSLAIDGQPSYSPRFSMLSIPPHQACVYKRSIICQENLSYDIRLKIYADGFFTRDFLEFIHSYIAVDMPLINYRSGGIGSRVKFRSCMYRIADLWRAFVFRQLSIGGFKTFLCCSFNQLSMLLS